MESRTSSTAIWIASPSQETGLLRFDRARTTCSVPLAELSRQIHIQQDFCGLTSIDRRGTSLAGRPSASQDLIS